MKSSCYEVWLVFLCAFLSTLVGACGAAPQLRTQPERFAFLDPIISDNLPRIAQCPNPKLTFQESKQVGTAWYDYYRLEGCGHRTAFITAVTRQDVDDTWIVTHEYGVAPTADELRAEAKGQLLKTAQFDLSCKANLEFEILNEEIGPMRTKFEGTIGVRGCGKRSTYRSVCNDNAYTQGKHDISCASVITSVSGT